MEFPLQLGLPIAGPLRRRLAKVHVTHKQVASSALLIGVLTLVAKLFVAGREIAIAWRYGVTGTVDAYQLALTIVTWTPMMLVSVMSAVFVPRLVELKTHAVERRRFLSELNGTVLVISIAIGLLTWAAAPYTSRLLGSNLKASSLDLTVSFCRAMSPVGLLMVWTGYLSTRLQSRERFAYTVTDVVPAIVIAGSVLLPLVLPPEIRLGWATSAGYAMQALVLAWMIRQVDRPMGTFAFRHSAPEWSSLYRDFGIMALGQIVFTLTLPIDQAFATHIGSGAVAALGYANRIIVLATGLGAVVFTRAFLPIFSRSVAEGSGEAAARHARQWALLLMAAGLIGVAVAWPLAQMGVSIVFQHGAFGAADSARVARVLRFGLLQIPFVFGGLALVQLLAANKRYSTLLWIACAAVVLKLALNFALVHSLDLGGLMLATAAMYLFSFLCQFLMSFKK